MARRVNTKFIIIMTAVLIALVGGVTFLALKVQKTYADHVNEAETALNQARNSQAAGNHEEADRLYVSATQHYTRAFGEDPSRIEVLDKIIEIKYDRRVESPTVAGNIINDIVSILRQAYEHNAATRDNRLRYMETLTRFHREELVVDGAMNWYRMIQGTTRGDVAADADNHLARRYLAITSVVLYRPDLRENERNEIREHLTAAMEHEPNDPELINVLALLDLFEGNRIRAAEGDRITAAAEQHFRAAAAAIEQSFALNNRTAYDSYQMLRLALSVPEQYIDITRFVPVAESLLTEIENDPANIAGLTAREAFNFAQLIETLSQKIDQADMNKRGIAAVVQALDAQQDSAQALMYSAQIKVLTQEHEESLATIDRGLKAVKPTNAEDYLLNSNSVRPLHKLEVQSHLALAERAGDAAERQSRLDKAKKAIEAYRSVEGVTGENTEAISHYYQGQAAWIAGDTRETIRQLNIANQQFNNNHFNTLRLIGIAHQQLENLGKAAEFYELALNRQPNEEVHLRLIQTYIQLGAGQLPRINELIDSYAQANPNDPRGAILRAQAIALSGNPRAAAEMLTRLNPEENPQLLPIIARYLVQAGDREQALQLLRARLEQEPSDSTSMQLLLNLLDTPEARIAEIDRLEGNGLTTERASELRDFVRLSASGDAEAQVQLIDRFGGDDFATAMQFYQLYTRRDEPEKAEEALAQAEAARPNDPRLLQILFERALRSGNSNRANQLVDRMLALPASERPLVASNEKILRTMVEAARFALDGGQDEAKRKALIAQYREALAQEPTMVDGWLQLAQLFVVDEQLTEARAAAKQAYDLQPTNPRAVQLYSQALAFTGDMPTALRTLATAVASDANNIALRNLYIRIAEQGGYTTIVINQREFVKQQQPSNYANRRALALAYLQQDRPSSALTEADAILNEQGPTIEGIALKAEVLTQQDQADQAIAVVQNYVNAKGDQATASEHLLLARMQINADQLDNATESYQKARAAGSESSGDVTRAFASLLLQAGQAKQAATLLSDLAKASPDDTALMTALVQSQVLAGELEQASSNIASLPASAQKELLQYEILLRQNNAESAMKVLESAVKKYPADNAVAFSFARAKAQANQISQAAQVIRKLAESAGEQNEVQLLLAQLEADEGDRDAARRRLRALVQKDPVYYRAREVLFFILSADADAIRNRNPERSAELSEQALAMIAPIADQLPENEQVNRLAGQAAVRVGQNDRAVRFFERAYGQEASATNLALLAQALTSSGSPTQAIELLRKPEHATDLNRSTELKVLWGQALAKSNQTEQAKNLFSGLLRDASEPQVQTGLAAAVCQSMPLDQAAQIFDAAFDGDPPVAVDAQHVRFLSQAEQWDALLSRYQKYAENPPTNAALREQIISQLALASQYSEKFEQAKRLYELMLKDNPRNMGTLNNLAYLLTDELTGYEDQAVEMAQRAVELVEEQAADHSDYTKSLVYDTLGWAQFKAGDVDLAIKTLDKSIELSANHNNQIHLALAYAQKGETNRAVSLLIQARGDALRSNNRKHQQEIAELLAELQ